MNNKVLVQIIVPTIEETYDIYLPINKRIGNVITLLNKTIQELTNDNYIGNENTSLYNRETNKKYLPNELIYNTDIRNGTALILL